MGSELESCSVRNLKKEWKSLSVSWQKLHICSTWQAQQCFCIFVVAIWVKDTLPPALWCWFCSTFLSPLPPFFFFFLSMFPSFGIFPFSWGRSTSPQVTSWGDTALEHWGGKIQLQKLQLKNWRILPFFMILKNNLSREWCLISLAEWAFDAGIYCMHHLAEGGLSCS